MVGHIDQHVADMLVRQFIEDLLGLPVAAHQPCPAQKPQMVTDQRLRQVETCRDISNRSRRIEAKEKDTQTRWVAKQPECLGKDGRIELRWYG